MSAFDIGGRIIIDGEFDETFDRLELRAEEAERALNDIEMQPPEGSPEFERMIGEQIEAVERLQAALSSITVQVDSEEANRSLDELRTRTEELSEKLASGQILSPVDTEFLSGAQRAVDLLEEIELKPLEGTEDFQRRIEEQLAAVEELDAKLREMRAEVDTDEADANIGEMIKRVGELREKLASGQELTPVELDFLADAQKLVEGFGGSLDGAAGKAISLAFNLGNIAKAALGVASGIAVAAGAVFNFVKQQGLMGEALLETERAFDALSNARGIDGDALLAGLEESARGAVGATELMRQANQVLLSESEDIATQLPALYDAARLSAQLTGRTVAQSFQGITNSVLRLDEAGLRAQGIFVNLSQANQEWAASNGRLAETLSLVEKQQIAANAAAEAALPLMRDMGLEAATAAEKLAMLPTVLNELKENFAKSVAGTEAFAAFLNLMQDLGQLAGTEADINETSTALRQLQAELLSLGESEAATELAEQIAAVEREAVKARSTKLSPADILEINQEELDRLRELAQGYRDVAAAANPELLKVDAFRIAADNANQAAEATSTFAAALDRARESMAGVSSLEAQFASAIAMAEDVMRNLPDMPDITAFMDTDALRAWGDAWAEINPNLAEANVLIQQTADALDENRTTILQQAAGIDDLGQRLQFLATAFLGAGAEVDELVQAMAGMPPEVLAAIGPVDELALAIIRLRGAATDPITIDVAMRGLQSTEATLESLAVKVADTFGLDQGRIFYDAARRERDQFWASVDTSDSLGTALAVDKWNTMLNDIVAMTDPALNDVEQSFQGAFDRIGLSAGELRGKIESALMEGSTVTAQDMADTLAGTYEDAPLEAARRLDAIAARGFAELQAHPDWAGLLKIPEEVLTGSEADLKRWAEGTAGAVRNLERPDLIDWDAFAANFEAGLNREAAREVTIDVALNELEGRGLLQGSKEERRQKVIEALGLEAPKLTFDALFKAEENANAKIKEQVGPITLEAALALIEEITPEDLLPEGETLSVEIDSLSIGPLTLDEYQEKLRDATIAATTDLDTALGVTLAGTPDEAIADWTAGLTPELGITATFRQALSKVVQDWTTDENGDKITPVVGVKANFIKPLAQVVEEWAAPEGGEPGVSVTLTPVVADADLDQSAPLNLTPVVSEADLAQQAELLLTPVVSELQAQSADLNLTPVVDDADLAQQAELLLTPVVSEIPEQSAVVLLTPQIAQEILAQSAELSLTPVVSEADLAQQAELLLTPVVSELQAQSAELALTPVVADADLAQSADLNLTPVVSEADLAQQAELLLTPVVAELQAQSADLNLTPVVGEAELAQSAELSLTPVVGGIPEQQATIYLTPELVIEETLAQGAELLLTPVMTVPIDQFLLEWIEAAGETGANVDVAGLFQPEQAQTELALAGAQAIGYVEAGAASAMVTSNIGQTVATSWATSFTAQETVFQTIGASAGRTVGGAFMTALEENVGEARFRIAEIVAPEVAAILASSGGGALP